MSTISNKVHHIYYLMGLLAQGEELYSQHSVLQEELSVDERTLRRYLEDIHNLYSNIITTYKIKKEFTSRKVTVYKIASKKDISKILQFFLQHEDELGWILQMVYENDPTLLHEYSDESRELLQKNLQRDKNAYLFITSPFEDLHNKELKELLSKLKTAVINREYKDITYQYDKNEKLKDVKCLKLLFINNNWYLSIETNEGLFRFLRVSFIKKVEYSKNKISFQKGVVEKYESFFTKVQNPFTLPREFKKAILQASPKIARYFKEEMKPFFPTQEFVGQKEDGSIMFSIEYTQKMEILPFIKQWMPDIKIISPETLKEAFLQDMKQMENLYKN